MSEENENASEETDARWFEMEEQFPGIIDVNMPESPDSDKTTQIRFQWAGFDNGVHEYTLAIKAVTHQRRRDIILFVGMSLEQLGYTVVKARAGDGIEPASVFMTKQ